MGLSRHFIPAFPLSWNAFHALQEENHLLSQGERGMGRLGQLRFPHRPSGYLSHGMRFSHSKVREGLDKMVNSVSHFFRFTPPFQGERGIGRLGHILFPRRPSGYLSHGMRFSHSKEREGLDN